jgi:hypothetical protein
MAGVFTIVQIIADGDSGDVLYRMTWPSESVAKMRQDWRIENIHFLHPDRFSVARAADLLVLYQNSDIDFLPIIEDRKKRGLKTIFEMGDLWLEVPPWNPIAEAWQSPLISHRYELLMAACDLVITPSTFLADELKKRGYARNAEPVPNEIKPLSTETVLPQRINNRIGWGGSLGHIVDLLSFSPILRELALESNDISFGIMGNQSIPGSIDIPFEKLHFTPWGSLESYFGFLGSIDIGIIPTLDTAFNKSRSDTKALEYSLLGVAPIVPNLPPYHKFIAETGIPTYGTLKEFSQLLRKTLLDADFKEDMRNKAQRYVHAKRLMGKDLTRIDLFSKLLPKAPTNSDPSRAPGLITLRPTKESAKTPSAQAIALAEIRKTIKSKDFSKAQEEFKKFFTENPKHPEALLLAAQTMPSYESYIQDGIKFYPKDLRFPLVKLLRSPAAESDTALQLLFKTAAKLTIEARMVIAKDLAKSLTLIITSCPSAITAHGEFIRYWPIPSVYAVFGELLTRKGDYTKGREYLLRAQEFAQMIAADRNFAANLDPKFFAAWIAINNERGWEKAK